MQRVVLDTNILIDFLRQPKKATLFRRLLQKKKLKILLPAVVLTELYVGKSAARASGERRVKNILKKVDLVLADQKISRRAGVLMREYPHLYLADALVAATALKEKAHLCTFNRSHFKEISGLKFFAREKK